MPRMLTPRPIRRANPVPKPVPSPVLSSERWKARDLGVTRRGSAGVRVHYAACARVGIRGRARCAMLDGSPRLSPPFSHPGLSIHSSRGFPVACRCQIPPRVTTHETPDGAPRAAPGDFQLCSSEERTRNHDSHEQYAPPVSLHWLLWPIRAGPPCQHYTDQSLGLWS